MSGIVGVLSGQDDAAQFVVPCLHGLQHLGSQSAHVAIMSGAGELGVHGGYGLVTEIFNEAKLKRLRGTMTIGQVSKASADRPAWDTCLFAIPNHGALGPLAIAFHGAFTNRASLLAELRDTALFSGDSEVSDPELLAHFLARARGSLADRLATALNRVRGAYALLILAPREQVIIAARDPHGVHALYQAELPVAGGVVLSSERTSFPLVEAHRAQVIRSGFMTVFRARGQQMEIERVRFAHSEVVPTPCLHRAAFIPLHTATDGDFGSVYRLRYALGQELAARDQTPVDFVAAVPMSGIVAGHGYAAARGLPFHPVIQKNPFGGRHVPEPDDGTKVQVFGTKIELGIVPAMVKGQRLVVVDDSLLVGSTARRVIKLLRLGGAREVHLRVASSPIKRVCPYGVTMPRTDQLLAARLPGIEQDANWLAQELGADSVLFLDQFRYRRVIAEVAKVGSVCDFCYGGGPSPEQV